MVRVPPAIHTRRGYMPKLGIGVMTAYTQKCSNLKSEL
jgi:hypothetical protein